MPDKEHPLTLGQQLGQLSAKVAQHCTSAQACHAVSEARGILQKLRQNPDQTDWQTALDLIEELQNIRSVDNAEPNHRALHDRVVS